jgi:signal transduction histidine kinase
MPSIDSNQQRSAGLPGLEFLYLVILIAIVGLVFINLEVNFRWLKNFSERLFQQAVEYELVQARRAAGMMENAAQDELQDIENLAHDLSLIGRTTPTADLFIEYFLKENYHIRELAIIGLTGRTEKKYSRSLSAVSGGQKDYANLEPFEIAKKGETFISHVDYNDFAEPYVIIASPVVNPATDSLEAVIIAHYFLRGMWEIALETKIGQTGRISVIDDKGMLVADPQPARVLKKTNLLPLPPAKTVIRGDEFAGAKYFNEKNVPVIGVGVPIKIKDQKWGVIVEQNASEMENLFSEVSRWLGVFLIGNGAVIIILVWLGYMIYRANRELRKKHRYLEEERNKSVAMVTNFVDPILLCDNNWRLVLFNPAARHALKLTDSDLGRLIPVKHGEFSLACFKGVFKARYATRVLTVNKEGHAQTEEIILNSSAPEEKNSNPFRAALQNDPAALAYKVTTTTVCDRHNVCYGHMKIFYDLTREKIIDELKSEFISIAAHQLRTPLSAIKWVIKMVLDGDAGALSEDQRALLSKGYQSNERIIKIVNDMLNVSRIEEGRFGYNFSPGDIKEVLDNILSGLENQIKSRKIKLVSNLPAKCPPFSFDQEKLSIVFQNIMDNAVKYTPENGRIEIKAEQGKKYWRFSVKDNGVGIPLADRKKVFTKFFRAANVVRMQTEGSGLGLYIAKNIIEKHGGTIKCLSQEGRGTEVVFTLALARPADKMNNGENS